MNPEFWLERWQSNQIGFHLEQVNPLLVRHFETLSGRQRLLVPFCGKSLDLPWLVEQGCHVTGVELSELAASAFHQEQKRAASLGRKYGLKSYSSSGLDFLVGDLFDLVVTEEQTFDAVYDRAALIAQPAGQRAKYVQHLRRVLRPDAVILLITITYDPAEMKGPPFAVTDAEVREVFRDFGRIDRLESVDVLDENPRFRQKGVTGMQESVFAIATT